MSFFEKMEESICNISQNNPGDLLCPIDRTCSNSDASLELRHLLESNGYQPPTLFIELLELTKEMNFRQKKNKTLGAT